MGKSCLTVRRIFAFPLPPRGQHNGLTSTHTRARGSFLQSLPLPPSPSPLSSLRFIASFLCLPQIRFVENKFPLEWFPTIEDAYVKKCLVDGEEALLRILDTAGQDDCASANFLFFFFLSFTSLSQTD